MKMINDERAIKSLQTINGRFWEVGTNDVTDIEPYHENGQMEYVIWFKIFANGELLWRVNSASVEYIQY